MNKDNELRFLYQALNALFLAKEGLKAAGYNGPTFTIEHEMKKIEVWINDLEEES